MKLKSDATRSSKAKVLCKYIPDFIKFGFVKGGSEAELGAQCVACRLTLANEALKPPKLRRHLESRRPELVGQLLGACKRKADGLQMPGEKVVGQKGGISRL